MNEITQETATRSKKWWLFMILGIILVLGSFYVFSTPLESFVTLSLFFSVIIFVDGLFSIGFAISNRHELEGWGWQLASGILSVFIGLSLMSQPALSLGVLPLFVGFWIIFRGANSIGASLDLKRMGMKNWGWFLFLGILVLIMGFSVMANPLIGAGLVVSLVGVGMLLQGFGFIWLSLALRRL